MRGDRFTSIRCRAKRKSDFEMDCRFSSMFFVCSSRTSTSSLCGGSSSGASISFSQLCKQISRRWVNTSWATRTRLPLQVFSLPRRPTGTRHPRSPILYQPCRRYRWIASKSCRSAFLSRIEPFVFPFRFPRRQTTRLSRQTSATLPDALKSAQTAPPPGHFPALIIAGVVPVWLESCYSAIVLFWRRDANALWQKTGRASPRFARRDALENKTPPASIDERSHRSRPERRTKQETAAN